MESMVDERYRLIILQHQVEGAEYKKSDHKWIFCCPFCSPFVRTKAKAREKKGVLLWNGIQNSWVFCCHRCGITTTFYRFLMLLNPQLAKHYQRDRWHSGTTGKWHNCSDPPLLVKGGSVGIATTC
jgi:hypothetical protein